MARKRRTMNPEQARQRRMGTYPAEMWSILQAASRGQEYKRTFMDHNLATAFLARFYRFRMDAIECRVSGAIYLRDVMVRGVDALGGVFNTRSAGAGAPYEMTWVYIGSEESREASARADLEDNRAGGQLLPPGGHQPEVDAVEKFLEGIGKPTEQTLTPEQLAHHEEMRKAIETSADLPHSLNQALCEHEWDATGAFCLKCKTPKP